ncbi:metallophosphoesterase family protein [Diaphorobacter ruginosibacter]|uniref:Metallophosphoesterase family protein n=1 Tax=Diaphorobacter ruginosibacter TaxID=1715720 RepID=A0A7G9RQ75_9BURK|nr:metallophosphoesterase [Diaphorobacter ruginosibacter]QNN57750.1 metallophosphoesterase family protein [Diaphorobacter ruginosibacter]
MKYALLADLHANLQALDACLEHARSLDVQQFAFVGDLVGYGGNPAEVLDRVMALASGGALCVRGNHDEAALSPPEIPRLVQDLGSAWTHAQLKPLHLSFLENLPLTTRLEQDVLLVHASADAPGKWHYVEDSSAAERSMRAAAEQDPNIRYVFSGHVHVQALYFLTPTAKLMRFAPEPGVAVPVPPHRQWLAIVGSCGQPRDNDPRAMYALYDSDAATITFHRVPYDHMAAAAAVRATRSLPAYWADRLEWGH